MDSRAGRPGPDDLRIELDPFPSIFHASAQLGGRRAQVSQCLHRRTDGESHRRDSACYFDRLDPELDSNSRGSARPPSHQRRAGDFYAAVKLARQQRGLTLDENDLWVAATAHALGATPVSRDGAPHTSARTIRPGRVTRDHTRSSAPPTAIPTSRNGNSSSHTRGNRTSATSASGQHSTSRMHHSRSFTTPGRPSVLVYRVRNNRVRTGPANSSSLVT